MSKKDIFENLLLILGYLHLLNDPFDILISTLLAYKMID